MKKAFTLPEFLISMIVIGVILVLTLPHVIDSMFNKTRVATLQRVYVTASSAVKVLMNNESAKTVKRTYLFKGASDSVEDSAGRFIKEYFKIAVDCGSSMTPCFASSYRALDPSVNIDFPSASEMYCVLLNMRASMCILPPDETTPGNIFVDVNGDVKPNIAGRDLFVFYIYNNGYVGDRRENADQCAHSSYGVGCFKKLVRSGWVMDY